MRIRPIENWAESDNSKMASGALATFSYSRQNDLNLGNIHWPTEKNKFQHSKVGMMEYFAQEMKPYVLQKKAFLEVCEETEILLFFSLIFIYERNGRRL